MAGATPLKVVDGRSDAIPVSRGLVRQAGEDGVAAVDMASSAIERVRHGLFTPGTNRSDLAADLQRALRELHQIRPGLAALAALGDNHTGPDSGA
jgi:hypothetical protein